MNSDTGKTDLVPFTAIPLDGSESCEFSECLFGHIYDDYIQTAKTIEFATVGKCLSEQLQLSLDAESNALVYHKKNFDNHRSCNGTPSLDETNYYPKYIP